MYVIAWLHRIRKRKNASVRGQSLCNLLCDLFELVYAFIEYGALVWLFLNELTHTGLQIAAILIRWLLWNSSLEFRGTCRSFLYRLLIYASAMLWDRLGVGRCRKCCDSLLRVVLAQRYPIFTGLLLVEAAYTLYSSEFISKWLSSLLKYLRALIFIWTGFCRQWRLTR